MLYRFYSIIQPQCAFLLISGDPPPRSVSTRSFTAAYMVYLPSRSSCPWSWYQLHRRQPRDRGVNPTQGHVRRRRKRDARCFGSSHDPTNLVADSTTSLSGWSPPSSHNPSLRLAQTHFNLTMPGYAPCGPQLSHTGKKAAALGEY